MERTKCEFALGGFEGGAERPVSGVSFRPKVPEPDWQAPLYAGWHRRVERPPPEGGGQCVGARRTPRSPLERGHLAGRGALEPLGEFRPRQLISRPWKGVASPSLSQNDVIVSNPGSAAARGVPDREENSR